MTIHVVPLEGQGGRWFAPKGWGTVNFEMANLDDDIAFFETQRAGLEAHHMGKWVLVHEQRLEGHFNAFEEAADQAVTRFGAGPYLIRQVGAPPVVLPASAMFNVTHG